MIAIAILPFIAALGVAVWVIVNGVADALERIAA